MSQWFVFWSRNEFDHSFHASAQSHLLLSKIFHWSIEIDQSDLMSDRPMRNFSFAGLPLYRIRLWRVVNAYETTSKSSPKAQPYFRPLFQVRTSGWVEFGEPWPLGFGWSSKATSSGIDFPRKRASTPAFVFAIFRSVKMSFSRSACRSALISATWIGSKWSFNS